VRSSLFLGQDPVVAELTGGYLRALALGIPPALLFVAARQYLEGMGHATAPMAVTFIGLAVNIVANRVLIYGVGDVIPALGVVGAGWATTIVRFAMLIGIVVVLGMHRSLALRALQVRPRGPQLRQIFRVGGPDRCAVRAGSGSVLVRGRHDGLAGRSRAGRASGDDQHRVDDVH
jgi:MATE family multidrug resistance protein